MKTIKITLIIIYGWFFAGVVLAQSISELRIINKPVALSSELVNKNIKDANGETCAMILVLTDLDGLSFNSYNGMCKDVSVEPGKYKIFLSPNERVLEIFKNGYKPLKIIFNEIGIGIKSGQVWQMEITGEKKLDLIAINIVPSEKDAEIFIDGVLKGTSKTHQVTIGKHEVMVTKNGFKTKIDTIDVSLNNILFNYPLERIRPLIITIKSVPDGASIKLNGTDIGKRTNVQHSIVPGKYLLKLQKYGYSESDNEIEVKEGGKNEFSFNLTKSTGTLNVAFTPADAELLLDAEVIRGGLVEVKPGEHTIELRKENYQSVFETINIATGEKLEKNYTLIKNTTQVSLNITPPEADLEINNQKYTDTKNIELPEGTYFLEIKKDGYKTYSEAVQLKREQKFSKNINLEPIFGSLQIIVQPIEANLRLMKGNKLIQRWQGSKIIDSLVTGSYTLEAEAAGYSKTSKIISVNQTSTSNEEIILSPNKVARVQLNNIIQEGSLLKNVSFESNGDGYIVKYDLSGELSQDYSIELFLMDKKDPSFSKKLVKVSGDIGEGKFAGRDKTIAWNSLSEYPGGIVNDNLYLKLTGEKIGGGIPWYVWAGGAVLGGAAAVLLGGSKTGSNNATLTIPNPPIRPGN